MDSSKIKFSDEDYVLFLHGGLGNQLFQWSFGIGLKNNTEVSNLVFVSTTRNSAAEHTQFEFSKIFNACNHGTFVNMNLSLNKFERFFRDPLEIRNPFNVYRNIIIDSTSEPLVNPQFDSQKRFYLGYYQNSFQVQKVSTHILPELQEVMESRAISNDEEKLFGRSVVHVRRGDALKDIHRKTIGVLSEKYYSDIRELLPEAPVILTDEVKEAEQIARILGAKEIYGPETFSAFQSLRIMSRSKFLVSANSTLSWWGSYLNSANGNTSVIPQPFYRNIRGLDSETFRIDDSIIGLSDFAAN